MATAKFGQIFCLNVLELTCNPVTRQIWAKIGTILATHAGLCGHDAKLHFYMMIAMAVNIMDHFLLTALLITLLNLAAATVIQTMAAITTQGQRILLT